MCVFVIVCVLCVCCVCVACGVLASFYVHVCGVYVYMCMCILWSVSVRPFLGQLRVLAWYPRIS